MKKVISLAAIICSLFALSVAQPPPPPAAAPGTKPVKALEPKSLADVKPTDQYKSWEGKFRIALPASSLSGYSAITPKTSGANAAGGQYNFRTKEAVFMIQFTDYFDPQFTNMSSEQIDQRLSAGVAGGVERTRGTKLLDERVTLGSFVGSRFKVALPVGGNLLARMYFVGARLYTIVGQPSETVPNAESLTEKTLASFALIPQSELDAEVAEGIRLATPEPLPQAPVTSKEKTDAEDENLKGRVKRVVEEDQDLSGTWQAQYRKRSSETEFDPRGNFLKTISYDSTGHPYDVTVWGYLVESRVTLSKSIASSSVLRLTAAGPPDTKSRDRRYSWKRLYKYTAGRLSEKQLIQNNGELWMKYAYAYSGNEMIELVYSENGKLNQKYSYRFDQNGNPTRYLTYDAFGDPNRVKRSYRYQYDKIDALGNWLQRTQIEVISENGIDKEVPSQIEYRTITYYP